MRSIVSTLYHGFRCSHGTRPRQSTLPWPWATTGLGRNGSPNVQLPRFRGQRPRLFGRRLLLAMLAGVKSLPNVKELTGRRTHALVHGFRANFLRGNTHGTRSSSTKRDIPTSFKPDSCCSCCRVGCLTLSLAALDGVSKRILIIFFVSNPTKADHWFCAKRYLILGLITS